MKMENSLLTTFDVDEKTLIYINPKNDEEFLLSHF